MDIPLTLAAQSFRLARDLQHSDAINGLLVIKNVSSKSYLRVSKAQWRILELFTEPRTVPTVLSLALDAHVCLSLGEFYELILKSVDAHVLVEPGTGIASPPVFGWRIGVRASLVARPLLVLLVMGILLSLIFQPRLPDSFLDAVGGLVAISAALSLGSVLAACIVRGGGGEVYPLKWRWWRLPPHFAVDTSDAVMLSTTAQQATALAQPALLATAAGLLTWQKPDWSFIPLLALAFSLRPILGGKFAALIRFNRPFLLSDAEHAFIFPPNRRPKNRWGIFMRVMTHPYTWARLAYGVLWMLALVYLCARLTATPPWTMGFWETNGRRVALAIGGSLAVLGTGYLFWELYYFAREHARTHRSILRRWYRRWFGAKKLILLEAARVQAVDESPVFRALPPPERQQLARLLQLTRHGAWRALPDYGPMPAKVSLIVSGRIGLYRKQPSGHLRRVQVLSEGDVVGLHDLADHRHPEYFARALTPLTLLTLDRRTVDETTLLRLPREQLAVTVLKLPFLRQIPLCQNWHFQAVERFATLSSITDVAAGSVIFPENQLNREFFVIFEGRARVTRQGRRIGQIRPGDFFGEIGLLQNSPSNAQVSARHDARCLSIDRIEFLRFVTHDYTVALELERVSSQRLGYPIFPLKKGNFGST
jgi:CRP-like cAMP-binding protein